MSRLKRPSPALVISIMALVAAIVVPAYAALTKGEKKTVKKLANAQITKRAPGLSVASAETANTAQTANNADQLDGLSSTAFHGYDATVPSGTTIRGLVAIAGSAADGSHTMSTAVSFPVRAPNDISTDDAHIDVHDEPTPGTCTGSFSNPTAPPGDACVYLNATNNLGPATGAYDSNGTPSPYGFILVADPVNVGGGVGAHTIARGSWAYTAP